MGRRPNATTKSGKYMNPADQQRKLDRNKELKRNKKQRSMIRTAIMKNRDADEILNQLRVIDDSELESDIPLRISLQDKREKLRKQFKETRDFYQKESNVDKVKEIDLKMAGYEAEKRRKMQQMAAIKFSMTGDMSDIPMPEGMQTAGAAMTPFLPSYAMGGSGGTMVIAPPQKKRVRFGERPLKPTQPPGPPLGIPPDFSDSDDDYYGDDDDAPLHNEDDFEPVTIPAELMESMGGGGGPPRGGGGGLPSLPVPSYPLINLSAAPPMHPSLLPPPPRMPLRMPPPPPGAPLPRPITGLTTDASVISAAPQVNKSKAAGDDTAVISAKAELRDLTGESARFVPTHLRVRREEKKKPVARTNALGVASMSATKQSAKTTEDAYADFMKEMEGLI